jgi:hypothetical protein
LNLQAILESFIPQAEVADIAPHGSGHIHETYAVAVNREGMTEHCILQCMNAHVFRNIPVLMANMALVTHHLRKIHSQTDEQDVLTLIPTATGQTYYTDPEGRYWRLFSRVLHAHTVDVAETPDQIYEAGCAYGRFLDQCATLSASCLQETIPDFHNGLSRYAEFRRVLALDPCDRARQVRSEIDHIRAQTDVFYRVASLAASGEVMRRVTHNDTKINNVMLDDRTGRARCVIDLDTVMPGLALFDLGDLVRTTASHAAEDEVDLSLVTVSAERVQAALDGYLAGAGDCLKDSERETLPIGMDFMPLIMATRFLTDYLAGDVYYKTSRPGHNLDRCRAQLRLRRELLRLVKD